ncbi:polycystin-1-like protein 1 [Pelodytes ibericus]
MGTMEILLFIYLSVYLFDNMIVFTMVTLDGEPKCLMEYVGMMGEISIFTNGTVFSTDADITFFVVTDEIDPLDFVWDFGDQTSGKSTSRSISKKYTEAKRYSVKVNATSQIGSFAWAVHTIFVQKKVTPNRLAASSSVLVNSTVTFDCRINSGTDVSYLWNFGDGTVGLGERSEAYMYMREGEFTVVVLAFNNVSSASLTKQIFVVKEPCQPPPVKHMGPQKIQIRRYEKLLLGVTFEAAIHCNISQGLHYSWSLVKSDGNVIHLPAHTGYRRQKIAIPRFFLEYGKYTAIARVQIVGNVVYSNYTVPIEVLPSEPVSVIVGGTHNFIDRITSTYFQLDGTASYDPDYPEANLSFFWKCNPVSVHIHPCFNSSVKNPLDSNGPIITFPVGLLDAKYDQYHFTLSVSSGERSSSKTQVFLSVRSYTNLRQIQLICSECIGDSVNWNEKFSVRVLCPHCDEYDQHSYSWKLYWINATESNSIEVFPDTNYVMTDNRDPSSNLDMLEFPLAGMVEEDSSGGRPNKDLKSRMSDLEPHYSGIQEGKGGSGGRGKSFCFSGPLPNEDTVMHPEPVDRLIDLTNSVGSQPVTLMIDWLQLQISDSVFKKYTSGISSQTVTFKPLVLKSNNMYMLDVSLVSHGTMVGRSQMYFTVNEMPQRIDCSVQPRDGLEVYTVFTIFCTSGKGDLQYEFSYQTSKSSKKTLYKGRDIQYYFNLPAGEPDEGYRITIFSQISNVFGSKTQPCPVNVTVLPRFFRNTSSTELPELELFNDTVKNISTLLLMGNHIEIRNYVALITKLLDRLYTEEISTAFDLQSKIRNTLISAVCSLPFQDQDEITSDIAMILDLLKPSNQVTAGSAMLIINKAKSVLKYFELYEIQLQRQLAENVIVMLSQALEVSFKYSETNHVVLDVLEIINELILKYIVLNNELHFNISTNLLVLQTSVHKPISSNLLIGSMKFNLPELLDRHTRKNNILNMSCFVSQLVYFKRAPFLWETSSYQLNGEFEKHNVFECFGRKKINIIGIPPVAAEMDSKSKHDAGMSRKTFSLFREKVNFHQFNVTPKNNNGALQIMIRFVKPNTRAFPVLILVRHSKKPSTIHFHIKQIHYWEGNSTQIFISTDFIRDKGTFFLALMDADYNRQPKNKYISRMINYTLDVQWTKCLYWLNKQWISEQCYHLREKDTHVNCSCMRLGIFMNASTKVSSYILIEDVSQFLSTSRNMVPCTIVFLSICLYILLAVICNLKDAHEEKNNGFVLLQDNSPTDQQLYAIIVDIGFRSRSKSTAKVYIVLHGEDGVSETRELYCPDTLLFGRNSRQTFIMSVPDNLGPIWKIHVWHNNCGHSPSLYLSHVIIKDLQNGNSWFFLAECWLAVDEGDGKVEREFTAIGHGLGFRKLFFCKFTEYLEDFHFWGSTISRPSYSWFTHTQRITICFVLLFGYMCFNSIVIHYMEEQYTVEHAFVDISTISLVSGFQATLAVYPIAVLLSLLFRFTEKKVRKNSGEEELKDKKQSQTNSDGQQTSVPENMSESNLTWQHFHYWTYDAWKKKYELDFLKTQMQSRNCSRSLYGSPSLSSESSDGLGICSPTAFRPVLKDMSTEYLSDHYSVNEQRVLNMCNVLPSWCACLAWLLCAVFSIISVTVTVLLSIWFGPTKCVLWLHALFFSVIYCAFVVQPIMIFVFAFFVAWRKQLTNDFFAQTSCEAVKYFLDEPSLLYENCSVYFRQTTADTKTNFEKILASRKRARYLRLARPPTLEQLREVKDKIRKRTFIQQTFRELIIYIIMISVVIFISLETFPHNQHILNQALKNEFIRNAKQPFSEIKTADHWWNWSFNVLLDGLYWDRWYNEAAANSEAGPVGGKFFLIGTPLLTQFRFKEATCTIPFFLPSIIQDCISSNNVTNRTTVNLIANITNAVGIQGNTLTWCNKIQCYKGKGSVSLGRSREEAYSTLLNIKNQQWMDRRTKALTVQFAVYNPSTNLFTTASLLLEFPPSRGVITSTFIESVKIYHITNLLDYFIMAFQMIFLGLALFNCYFQLTVMIQKGIKNYWKEHWNWIEICITGLTFCYFTNRIYRFMLAIDIIDALQKGFFREFINFSVIVAVEQLSRYLHGGILFFMILKLIRLLHMFKVMTPWMNMFHHSLVNAPFIMLFGVICLLAYSSLGHLIFISKCYSFSSMFKSFHTVFILFLGVGGPKHTTDSLQSSTKHSQASAMCFYLGLLILMALIWTGMSRGILITFAKDAKKTHRSKHYITFKEIISYARERMLTITGFQKPKSTDGIHESGNNFYLDEFEDLIDELLFRLNAISNSLHHSLPVKPHYYAEEEDEVNHNSTCSSVYIKQSLQNSMGSEECIQQGNIAKENTSVTSVALNTEQDR